jgi:hypothetical protein
MKVPNVTTDKKHNGMLYPNAISYINFNNILTEIICFLENQTYSPVIPQTLAALHLHIPFPSL